VLSKVPPDKVAAARQQIAQVVRLPEFGMDYLKAIMKNFPIGEVPTLDQLLANTGLRASGPLGDTLQKEIKLMRRVEKKIPELDPRVAEAVRTLRAKTDFLLDAARGLKLEVKEAIEEFGNAKQQFDEADRILADQENLMMEGRIRNDKTAAKERERSKAILNLCVTLQLISEEMGKYLGEIKERLAVGPNEELQEAQEELISLGPVVEHALGSLVPFIETTAQNVKIFLDQRNADALTEFQLSMFRGVGMAQWKVNFVVKLQAAMNAAAQMELRLATEAMQKAGVEADQAYVQQMQEVAAQYRTFIQNVEAVRNRTAKLIEATHILEEGVRQALEEKDHILIAVEDSYQARQEAQAAWVSTVTDILSRPTKTSTEAG
jgi:cell fate (sporulation/competence/biofilm development) regulator YlbF (YheA/YmcA/DUF963 family)